MTGIDSPDDWSRPTALITGASSGLGACFARHLARSGHDLVLVARSVLALQELAAELHRAYRIRTEVLVADLTHPDDLEVVTRRIRAVEPRPIDTVVNNAGLGFYGPVSAHAADQELAMVDVDVRALVALSHAALQVMVPRRRGKLLNVGSTAGFSARPGSATYSAAKAFVLQFTEAVHEEAAPSAVHVSVLCPGFTRTNFHASAGVTLRGGLAFAWSDVDDVVRQGLAALDRNQMLCVPGVLNKVVASSPRVLPRSVMRRMTTAVMKRL